MCTPAVHNTHFWVVMPMMRIVGMRMRVSQHLMMMQVAMVFSQMQPHPQPHQGAGQSQLPCDRFGKKQDRDDSPDKWRR